MVSEPVATVGLGSAASWARKLWIWEGGRDDKSWGFGHLGQRRGCWTAGYGSDRIHSVKRSRTSRRCGDIQNRIDEAPVQRERDLGHRYEGLTKIFRTG